MLSNKPSNLELDFYYDETNNIRKFYLTSNKPNYINSEATPFILGGIATQKLLSNNKDFNNSVNNLYKNWDIQNTQKEVKFRHIATGDFPAMLTSKKLNNLLDLLSIDDIFIHFQVIDVVHWSLIDIIESITAARVCEKYFWLDVHIFDEVKALLTEIARTYKSEFFQELFKIGYPDVINNKDDFIYLLKRYLCKFAKSEKYQNSPINPLLLKITWDIFNEFEKVDVKNDAFCFLDGELSHELIDKFDHFYLFPIEQLPKSYHYFDEEKQVMERLKEYPNKYLNYEFVKSDNNKLIQLADIVVGFLRCLLNYVSSIDYCDIETNYQNFNEQQKKCLQKFFAIYEKSVQKDDKMVIFTWSIFDFFKFNVLRDLCKTDNKHFPK